MKKRQAKSDPIKSAKRVLDQIIAKHDTGSMPNQKVAVSKKSHNKPNR